MTDKSDGLEHQIHAVPSPSIDAIVPGNLLSVSLSEGNKVAWIWTHLPNGRSFVSGYEVYVRKSGTDSVMKAGQMKGQIGFIG